MSSGPLICLSLFLLMIPRLIRPKRVTNPETRGLIPFLWRLNRLYCAFMHRLETQTPAPLPETGPAILISNHTCGIDHMVLQAGSYRILGFMIAQEFYDHWLIHPFCEMIKCIPVRRDGRDLSATRAALRTLGEGRVLPIFPEGRILPTSGRELGEGKPGTAFIALRANVPIIPAYISGTPETNDVWKALWTPSKAAKVIYGPAVDLSDVPRDGPFSKETLSLVTDRLMAAIRELRDQSTNQDGAPGVELPETIDHADDQRFDRSAVAVSGDCAALLPA